MEDKNQKYCRCLKCNRKLKTDKAKNRGYGDICWKEYKKHLKENHTFLFKIVK